MSLPGSAQEIPTLMEHLLGEYVRMMETHNKTVETNPEAGEACDVQKELDRVSDFNKFAKSYLDKNRPLNTFAVDANVGIKLGDNAQVVISPGFNEIAGTMQHSQTVPMTSGQGLHPRQMNQMSSNTTEIGLENEYHVPGQKK
jgi:hypothetical protein